MPKWNQNTLVCKQAVSDLVHTSETRKRVDVPAQEINIVTLDDGLSGVEHLPSVDNKPLSCSASISTASIRNISARSEEKEFITAAMFISHVAEHVIYICCCLVGLL